MEFSNLYTSVACNRSCGCADINSSGLVAFGACNSISILDTKSAEAKIVRTLIQHKKRVNVVKWIHHNPGKYELISGGDDNIAIMWSMEEEENTRLLEGHKSGITAVDTINKADRTIIVTSASDSTVRCWENNISGVKCFQIIDLKDKVCLTMCLGVLPILNKICLAYSSNDSKIHLLFESSAQELAFEPTLELHGHENWVQGLDFTIDRCELLLASASLDATLRLWRITVNPEACDHSVENARSEIETTSYSTKVHVNLESIMQGHDNWVYSVNWNQSDGNLKLLSCSADKTMIVWAMGEDGIWAEEARLGDVGGNIPGYYGGKFSPDGKSIVAYDFCGKLQKWTKAGDGATWKLSFSLGGHFGPVRSVSWEPGGQYVLSASADQTTLLHAPIPDSQGGDDRWLIVARPQEHGYEIRCVTAVGQNAFASAGEEKVVRVFGATADFHELVCDKFKNLSENERLQFRCSATKPLNLSNNASSPLVLSNSFATEEALLAKPLWSEVRKLYGHGHEVFTLCSSSNGDLLAASSKLMPGECAPILIWETKEWKIIQRISTSQSTITQMKFSRDGLLLLSVSKDRTWALFKNCGNNGSIEFQLQATSAKVDNNVHKRIIWCCSWSHDSNFFATGSRDGKLAVWRTGLQLNENHINPSLFCVKEIAGEAVTACAFAFQHYRSDMYLLACGFESGMIKLYGVDDKLSELIVLKRQVSHHLSVECLEFRPIKNAIQLASCGADHILRIYEFYGKHCST